MTSTAAKATSQALTLAKPGTAPVAVKADRAPVAQDRSAGFADVLAEKSRGRSEEDCASKSETVSRGGADAGATLSKPGGGDRSVTQDEAAAREGDDCAAASGDAGAKPSEAEQISPVAERSRLEDGEGGQTGVGGAEVVAATVVTQRPHAPRLCADEAGDSNAEPTDAAISKLPSEEASDGAEGERAGAAAASHDAKRPAPASNRIASNSAATAQRTTPDRTATALQGRAAAADESAQGVATATAERPLTIRELNEMLVRIDPQWAAKGLSLPVNMAAAKAAALSDDGPSWNTDSKFATFQHAPTDSVQANQDHVAGVESSNSTPNSTASVSQAAPEQARSNERTLNPDRAAHAADAAKPVANAVDRPVAASAPAATSAAAQPLDRTGEKAAPVGPAHGRGVLSIDSTRPNAKPVAANPATNASPQSPAFAAQVQRGLAAAIAQGGGQVTLRLNPEALGQLRVKLDLRADVVKLRFEVGSSAARSLLDEQLPGLGRMLEAQGLRVAHCGVGTDSSLAPTHTPTPPQSPDANGTGAQFLADGGGQWAGQDADGGAQQRQASENAGGRIESAEAGQSPRSGEIHIEREGGVLDPVTLRLNAIA